MTRSFRLLLISAGCLGVLPLTGSPALAAPVPVVGPANAGALAVVPAQAPIVLQIRGVERTKDRLTAFVNAAVPDFGPVVAAQIDQMLKSGVEGRKLEGLAKDGPDLCRPARTAVRWWPAADGRHRPGHSYKEFRDGLLTEDERKSLKSESGHETGRR